MTTPHDNTQITDAVTFTNAKPPIDASAIALSMLYQQTVHALGIAAENAVAAQQQNNMVMQAATTQAVMQLLSLDTASATAALSGNQLSSTLPAKETATALKTSAHANGGAESSHHLGHVADDPWNHAARELMHTVACALRGFQQVEQETDMAIVKQAATAAVLLQMIKEPEKLESYQKVLALIEKL